MMNLIKTFGRTQTASAETVRALDLEEMALVSGGSVSLTAPDPTNPQCPGPRWHPDFTHHVNPPRK
jgi:hypothetical protein